MIAARVIVFVIGVSGVDTLKGDKTVVRHGSWMVTSKLIDGLAIFCCGVATAERLKVVVYPMRSGSVVNT